MWLVALSFLWERSPDPKLSRRFSGAEAMVLSLRNKWLLDKPLLSLRRNWCVDPWLSRRLSELLGRGKSLTGVVPRNNDGNADGCSISFNELGFHEYRFLQNNYKIWLICCPNILNTMIDALDLFIPAIDIGRFCTRRTSSMDDWRSIAIGDEVAINWFSASEHRVIGQIRITKQTVHRIPFWRGCRRFAAGDRIALITGCCATDWIPFNGSSTTTTAMNIAICVMRCLDKTSKFQWSSSIRNE